MFWLFAFLLIESSMFVSNLQDKTFNEFCKKVEKYETVKIEVIPNGIKYHLNLSDTSTDEIEAYLEITKEMVVLKEKINGK